MSAVSKRKPRELTGRDVLLWLLAFFGVVFAINVWMVRAATSTFGGLETQSSYKAGLMFESEVARAGRQEALHWQVDGTLKHDSQGDVVLNVTVRDTQSRPVTGLMANATLAHPADARLDEVILLSNVGAGAFRGAARGHSGQRELIVDFYRGPGGERMFRSRSRITIR
jgi:nitrogen fixation protein FixH